MMKFIILVVIIIVSAAGYFAVERQVKDIDEVLVPVVSQEQYAT